LDEFWQEQSFGGFGDGFPPAYDPSIHVSINNQGVSRTFAFAENLKAIVLNPDDSSINQHRYTRPASVLIKDDDIIEITKVKQIYTVAGWKAVEIVSRYKRYTMST
jgi:hypothetical protein